MPDRLKRVAADYDIKGYYRRLGVPPTATPDEIKCAFRDKAKALHPDQNQGRDTTEEFQRLSEAYETLKDPLKRKEYNAAGVREAARENEQAQRTRHSGYQSGYAHGNSYTGGHTGGHAGGHGSGFDGGGPWGHSSDGARAYQRYTHAGQQNSQARGRAYQGDQSQRARQQANAPGGRGQASGPSPSPFFSTITGEAQLCSSCGVLSAQPRVVRFWTVRGVILQTYRKSVTGVLCARCARRKGFWTNAWNWLLGWWGIPSGPLRTIEATFTNMVGGQMPALDNAMMLARQALSFHQAGYQKLGRSILEDALDFAPDASTRREILNLRDRLGGSGPAPRLKNQWRVRNQPLFYAQLAPLSLVIGGVLWFVASLINFEGYFSFLNRSDGSEPAAIQTQQTPTVRPVYAPPRGGEARPFEERVRVPAGKPPLDETGNPTQSAANVLRQARVALDRVAVLDAPDADATQLMALVRDQPVTVLADVAIAGWRAIRLSGGATGYVPERALASPPVAE